MKWTVTVEFPDLPDDADADSVTIMVTALLDSNGEVPYNIKDVTPDE